MNEELKVGGRVMLLYMDDPYSKDTIDPGTWGTVKSVSEVYGIKQYYVNWDDGTKEEVGKGISSLALLADSDAWTKEDITKKRKKTNETRIVKKKNLLENNSELESEWQRNLSFMKNINAFRFFNMKFFMKYLTKLRDTGIVNMFGASPYLYLGKNRIEHEFKYQDVPNEEAFEELLDMSDESQANMINGVIKVLEDEGKEPDMSNINRYLQKYSSMILENFILLFKG